MLLLLAPPPLLSSSCLLRDYIISSLPCLRNDRWVDGMGVKSRPFRNVTSEFLSTTKQRTPGGLLQLFCCGFPNPKPQSNLKPKPQPKLIPVPGLILEHPLDITSHRIAFYRLPLRCDNNHGLSRQSEMAKWKTKQPVHLELA
jgi:predicted nucleic acid binding AN1-type Zn finger protein